MANGDGLMTGRHMRASEEDITSMIDTRRMPEGLPPWRSVIFDGNCLGFARTAEQLFSLAIEPACIAFAAEVDREPRGETDETIDRWEDARVAQLELHRSMALSLGGLWERNFRRHLWKAAAVLKPGDKAFLRDTQRGGWKEMSHCFEALRGFPLSAFPSSGTLELLHLVSSAARHGDGATLSKLHASHPELFLEHDVTVGFFSYFAHGGEPPDTIRKLEISLDQLRTFATAISEFWLAIRELHAGGV